MQTKKAIETTKYAKGSLYFDFFIAIIAETTMINKGTRVSSSVVSRSGISWVGIDGFNRLPPLASR